MTKNNKIFAVFDALGIASLVVSIFALAGAIWFVDPGTQGVLIGAFQYSFAGSVLCFLLARTVQITDVIRSTPDPKSLRVVAANEGSSPEIDSSNVVAGEIRRAA